MLRARDGLDELYLRVRARYVNLGNSEVRTRKTTSVGSPCASLFLEISEFHSTPNILIRKIKIRTPITRCTR